MAPPVPAGLAIDYTASNAVKISWGNVAGEVGYYIYRSLDDITYILIGETAVDIVEYWDNMVGANTLYYYKVSSYNGGESALTAAVNTTTLTQSLKKAWFAGQGAASYDENAVYLKEEVRLVGSRCEGVIRVEGTPVEDEDVLRLVDASIFATKSPSFVTMAASADLANERVLTGGTNLSLVDNGPGSTAVLSVDAHAADHEAGGADLVDHDNLTNTHNLTTDIDHDQLLNFLANEHIDWTGAAVAFSTSGSVSTGEIIPSGRIRLNTANFINGDTTPLVSGGNVFGAVNTAPTNITTFDGGTMGQPIIIIMGNANTTFVNGATLRLQGGINWNATILDTLSLINAAGVWYETSRSAN